MKLFGRTGGYYLFWLSTIYLVIGLTFAVYYKTVPAEYIQIVWIFALALPFLVPPVGRYFNMSVDWDKNMIDWFKSREERKEEYNNVVKFPEPVAVPEPGPEEHYRVGFTTDGDTTLTLMTKDGTSMTLTMNRDSCEQLIKMLRATYIEDEENV
jgi:hypothetical protein